MQCNSLCFSVFVLIILIYGYLSRILNAGLLLVMHYFNTVLLVLLHLYSLDMEKSTKKNY